MTKRKSDRRDARLGAAIKDRRIKLDMTQAELADTLGVGIALVSRWESGTYRIPLSTFLDIAQALRVRPSRLISAALKQGQ